MPTGLLIMPVLDNLPMTLDAIGDALQQLGGAAEVWVINQGSTRATREGLDALARTRPRLTIVTHDPPLPSLGQTWNTALEAAWACGHEDALVVNNDIRMAPHVYDQLREAAREYHLWFASPVNVRDQADPSAWERFHDVIGPVPASLGGPDFSCFLLTREGHTKYPFDTCFQPAYAEDNSAHRRYWLGGDGARIAGLPIPYLHYGGQTVKQFTPQQAERWDGKFDAVMRRYEAMWGGRPHHERRITPDSNESFDGIGTPGGWLGGKYPTVVEDRIVWKDPGDAESL